MKDYIEWPRIPAEYLKNSLLRTLFYKIIQKLKILIKEKIMNKKLKIEDVVTMPITKYVTTDGKNLRMIMMQICIKHI